MSLTTTEEAQLRLLLAEQSAILSLAGSEPTIISKLGATKVTLSDLTAATSPADADLMLINQGTTSKSITPLLLKNYVAAGIDARQQDVRTVGASVAANALTVTLAPTKLDFRSSTLTSGVVNTRSNASQISLTVPSTATLGTVSGVASRVLILAIDNAGTIELAVYNAAGGANLDETGVITTTAIAGGSNSLTVYSQTARTGVPYRIVGFVNSTQATAGTWASAPTLVQGVGGQALAAMSSFGYGQVTQDLTGSRAIGATYYNTTGKPILVSVQLIGTVANSTLNLGISVGGVTQFSGGYIVGATPSNYAITGNAVIPPGAAYVVTATQGSLASWSELR